MKKTCVSNVMTLMPQGINGTHICEMYIKKRDLVHYSEKYIMNGSRNTSLLQQNKLNQS